VRLPNLASGDRRALLIGLAVAAPIVFWMLGATPYLHAVQETRARLETSRDLLARERRLLAGAPQYPAALAAGKTRLAAVSERLLDGSNEAAAATALATYLRGHARPSHVLLSELESAPAENVAGGMTAVALNVSGESDLEGLLTFLRALESGSKLVHVDQLEIESAPQHGAAGGAGVAPAGPEVLSFRLRVKGFALGTFGASPEASP
jgi:hypothetical protein